MENFDLNKEELHILIIDNNSPFVLPILRSLSGIKNISADVLMYSAGPLSLFRYSRYVRKVFSFRELEESELLKVLSGIIRKRKIDFIIPTQVAAIQILNRIKDSIEPGVSIHPVPDNTLLETVTNKHSLNSWLKDHGFPFARILTTREIKEGSVESGSMSYPALLKPVNGSGGEGIRSVNSRESMVQMVQADPERFSDYILQEFIPGYDIDASLFAVNGKILYYTLQKGIINGNFSFSRGIEFLRQPDFYRQVERIISAMQYTGIAHLDFRYREATDEFILIDFNPRYWSSLLGSCDAGINFPLLAIQYTYGITHDSPAYHTGTFFFGLTALRTRFLSLFRNDLPRVSLKHTQLAYIWKDPLPEILYFFFIGIKNFILKAFRKIRKR